MNYEELERLTRGEQRAWDSFVDAHTALIHSAVVRTIQRYATGPVADDEIHDVTQDVFVRLCNREFRLLKTFDPARASMSTWLTIVSRSTAIDHLRRKRGMTVAFDSRLHDEAAPTAVSHERVPWPVDLLSPRQELVMRMLYDDGLDTADIAKALGIDTQTVRSTHHKAIVKLREYLQGDARHKLGY